MSGVLLKEDDLCFVHGSPNGQHEYLLPDINAFTALERVVSTGADTLFCGHTHVPYVRTLENNQLLVKVEQVGEADNHYQFTPKVRQIVNAGSVGEPRHGRPNATYALYDTDERAVKIQEVEYDYHKTCAAIIEEGLPPIFAWRLAQGLEFAERADDPSHVCER